MSKDVAPAKRAEKTLVACAFSDDSIRNEIVRAIVQRRSENPGYTQACM